MSQSKDNARLKSYKNKALNSDEMRRRREEEGLQLRKQKKDEQVCMGFNMSDTDINIKGAPLLVPPSVLKKKLFILDSFVEKHVIKGS